MSGLTAFGELREEIRRTRLGDGGVDVAAALTAALDTAVTALAEPIAGEPLAVVAVGGYGRGDQCLYSDVDLMVLHAGADLERAVNAVFYPMWDANLKVGHSVRTVKEALSGAKSHFETLTSLLTMRFVAGDAALVAELESALGQWLKGRPLATRLAEAERERRHVDPYPVMAADLKNGRGGLRTFQGFGWERRRAQMQRPPLSSAAATEAEAEALVELLRIRNALHAAAGRAVDVFVQELREPAAKWLGVDVPELAARLCRALEVGDRLAEQRWPDLLPGHGDPMVAVGRRVFGRVTRRFRSAAAPATHDSPLALAVRAAARPEGVWLDSVETARVRASAAHAWEAADRDALVDLLSAGARGRAAFRLLDQLGWVAEHLPEWQVVRALPQLAPFHEHPVDAHLWRTVDEMRRLIERGGADERAIAEDVGSTEELLLAALLHDIGKGHGGRHAEVGADIARRFLRDSGFGAATIAVVTKAVRHHLLLSETATRRDLDDPNVIAAVADAVEDRHTLNVLYLLTIADLAATGRSLWSAWKASLLRALYGRVEAVLAGEEASRPDRLAALIRATADHGDHEGLMQHAAAMPDAYLATTDPDDVLWHAGVLESDPAVADVAVRAGDIHDTALVVGRDRRGFLRAVAGVFALHGISILSARLFTRRDGTAVDVFRVCDDRTAGSVPAERWERVRRDLVGALEGAVDLGAQLAERAQVYRREKEPSTPARVRLPEGASAHYTVIEVRCGDRVGRLAEIVEALYTANLDIALAMLDTRAGEVVDTFYVRRGGHPLRGAEEQDRLVRDLETALTALT